MRTWNHTDLAGYARGAPSARDAPRSYGEVSLLTGIACSRYAREVGRSSPPVTEPPRVLASITGSRDASTRVAAQLIDRRVRSSTTGESKRAATSAEGGLSDRSAADGLARGSHDRAGRIRRASKVHRCIEPTATLCGERTSPLTTPWGTARWAPADARYVARDVARSREAEASVRCTRFGEQCALIPRTPRFGGCLAQGGARANDGRCGCPER
jgi:hypothetical protein